MTIRWDDVRRSTPLGGIECHKEIGSTNDRALALAGEAGASLSLPFLVAAESQTSGRGRGRNRWWSGGGSLLFSLIVEWPVQAAARRPMISLAAGLALCEAIEEVDSAIASRVKWPNDVYLGDGKVCGILVETTGTRVVIGVGINVNNRTADAPVELQSSVASLCESVGYSLDRTDALIRVVRHLCQELERLAAGDDLVERFQRRCWLTGRVVRIEAGGHSSVGRCRGIDEEGALLVDTEHGPERHLAGTVTSCS